MQVPVLTLPYCQFALSKAVEKVKFLLGLPDEIPWRAEQNGRWSIGRRQCLIRYLWSTFWPRFLPLDSPLAPEPLLLLPNPGLRGGKGGFGSLLRAIGAQVKWSEDATWIRGREIISLLTFTWTHPPNRLRQQPTMRPWGTWPAEGREMWTTKGGSKSRFSIYRLHSRP